MMTGSSHVEKRERLLKWYRASARPLPWRLTSDPYAIWVSEVMLQQTQVERVLLFYEPFLRRFPSIQALASASWEEVLAAWRGLGYYQRARLLHQSAQIIVRDHNGVIPQDPKLLRQLPGVGPYMAGAIASIAFGLPEPAIDGNVARVLSRICKIEFPLGTRESNAALWKEAHFWVQCERPGEVNQALIECGAVLCTPRRPKCATCPLCSDCLAKRDDVVEWLPRPRLRRPPQRWSVVALLIENDKGEVLVFQH
ncbi:MAG: A/G-specific adenine glycosylase, partial [Sandaracinaceae bacterium]|nr:A/G-specific adenine glycosylase [Sandaracinaceae bacterium]